MRDLKFGDTNLGPALKGIKDALHESEAKAFPKRLTIRITKEQHKSLKTKSFQSDMAVSEIIRALIDEHVAFLDS
ncbi:MAG: hypothetical protein P4M05_21165 [Bradyrhizobium sp.]|nr:hypothetical protein [Bradyrhizobium sp.]